MIAYRSCVFFPSNNFKYMCPYRNNLPARSLISMSPDRTRNFILGMRKNRSLSVFQIRRKYFEWHSHTRHYAKVCLKFVCRERFKKKLLNIIKNFLYKGIFCYFTFKHNKLYLYFLWQFWTVRKTLEKFIILLEAYKTHSESSVF